MTDYKKEQKYNYQIERILLEDSKKRRISSMGLLQFFDCEGWKLYFS